MIPVMPTLDGFVDWLRTRWVVEDELMQVVSYVPYHGYNMVILSTTNSARFRSRSYTTQNMLSGPNFATYVGKDVDFDFLIPDDTVPTHTLVPLVGHESMVYVSRVRGTHVEVTAIAHTPHVRLRLPWLEFIRDCAYFGGPTPVIPAAEPMQAAEPVSIWERL